MSFPYCVVENFNSTEQKYLINNTINKELAYSFRYFGQ